MTISPRSRSILLITRKQRQPSVPQLQIGAVYRFPALQPHEILSYIYLYILYGRKIANQENELLHYYKSDV